MNLEAVFFAAMGGMVPAFIWLLFWLREDAKHPEPKRRIAAAFLGGCVAVLLVLPLETWTAKYLQPMSPNTFMLWAFFEETLKLIACYFTALSFRDDDEPIDAMIYLLSTALGFSAVENALFLFTPLSHGQILQTIITGNLRFMGASLLHVISSGTLGIFIALSFYRARLWKILYAVLGLITAVLLHTGFNLFIIKETNGSVFTTFGIVWGAVIVLMLLFEKIKTISPKHA